MAGREESFDSYRKRLYEIVEVGAADDAVSRTYDFVGIFFILLNLTVSIMLTYDSLEAKYGKILLAIEAFTVFYFMIDYVLRIISSKYRYPKTSEKKAVVKYIFSGTGLIDLFSFLPYYLPFFFPAGAVAFRMFRILRIFRLFRVNAYYDSLNVITDVIGSRKQQLLSSVFIILILMIAASLCMYSLEHDAQPEVFNNAFSGIWWAVSTLLTIGYGDIYPITQAGKWFSIVITFLGVGMVAIPTGIISAGFVEQYTKIKRHSEYLREEEVHFIKIHLGENDSWVGKTISEIRLPGDVLVAVIRRGDETIVPRGNVLLMEGDILVLGAEPYDSKEHVDMTEMTLGKHNEWNGQKIKDLDISRQTMIVMVRRNRKILVPNGDLVLQEGDKVVMYSKQKLYGTTEYIV
ncbi:MAG: ion transporter [Lachnospiraceae bacterium]|nr:ion transporter [Lachnospiraceae bacterium]